MLGLVCAHPVLVALDGAAVVTSPLGGAGLLVALPVGGTGLLVTDRRLGLGAADDLGRGGGGGGVHGVEVVAHRGSQLEHAALEVGHRGPHPGDLLGQGHAFRVTLGAQPVRFVVGFIADAIGVVASLRQQGIGLLLGRHQRS